jgi:FkbM family methyltransferase
MKLLIEVGAFDGSDSIKYYNNGYRVFTFEPKKDLFLALQERTKNLKNYTVINKAVCLFDGITTFNICKEGGASSILNFKPDKELEKTWTSNRKDIQFSGISYNVNTTRLDTFIEQYGLQNEIIDFIHIDAQGVDLDVLQSLGKYISNVQEGVVETVIDVNKSIYVEQNNNTLSNIQRFLYNNGFTITNVLSNDITGCEYNVLFKKI